MYDAISGKRKVVLSSTSGEGLGLVVSAASELARSHLQLPDYLPHNSRFFGTNASESSGTITKTGRGVAL